MFSVTFSLSKLFYLLQCGGCAQCKELSVWWNWRRHHRCPPAWQCLIYACMSRSTSILMAWGSLPHALWWLLLKVSIFLSLPLSSTLGNKTGLHSCGLESWGERLEDQRALVVAFVSLLLSPGGFLVLSLCPRRGDGSLTGLGSRRYRYLSKSPSCSFHSHSSSNSCCSLCSLHGVSLEGLFCLKILLDNLIIGESAISSYASLHSVLYQLQSNYQFHETWMKTSKNKQAQNFALILISIIFYSERRQVINHYKNHLQWNFVL